MFVIFLACLACNIMLVASDDCRSTATYPNFDTEKFTGKWYVIYLHSAIYKQYHHMAGDLKGAPNYELSVSAVTQGTEKTATYDGYSKPFESQPGHYEVNLPKFAQFNGHYAVIATDYTNYAVVRGCASEGNFKDFTFIQFRNEHPSEEYVHKAQKAMEAAHLNFNELERDKYY